jgi:hypothetical protein
MLSPSHEQATLNFSNSFQKPKHATGVYHCILLINTYTRNIHRRWNCSTIKYEFHNDNNSEENKVFLLIHILHGIKTWNFSLNV